MVAQNYYDSWLAEFLGTQIGFSKNLTNEKWRPTTDRSEAKGLMRGREDTEGCREQLVFGGILHMKLCILLLASLFVAAFAAEGAYASDVHELLNGVASPSSARSAAAKGSPVSSLLDVNQDIEASLAQYVP